MRIYDLKTNHTHEMLGLDENPYFSWKLRSEKENTKQASYRIVVSDKGEIVWDSGVIASAQTIYNPYQGKKLKSCTRYDVTVSVSDNHEDKDEISSYFETAFLDQKEMKALWVEADEKIKKRKKGFGNQPAPTLFRRTFNVEQKVFSARLYATCLGIYEASLNGKRVDDRSFAPEYTSYDHFINYQVYDVTDLIREGENVLGMYVADGWYFCPITTMNKKTAKMPHAVFYQLEIILEDGTKQIVCSDGSEKTGKGAVLYADLFAGEAYDANKEIPGWNAPDFDDSQWKQVKVSDIQSHVLKAQLQEPVRAVKEVKAQKTYISPKGERIIDFGQNLAGHVRFNINVPASTKVTLDHFEIPDKDGNYFNNILGTKGIGGGCDQKVEYISNGTPSMYEAKFSFHGFRYVRISGLGQVNLDDFTAVAISTDKKSTGTFECSDERLNRLYENTLWSQRSNMLSIPTDCPQREKAGWTGDIGIYAATSLQNEDTTGLLTGWLRSVAADQSKKGAVPMVVPNNVSYKNLDFLLSAMGGFKGEAGVAGWGDACILVPLAMYEQTGNTIVLEQMYEAMKKWCDFIISTAKKYRGNKKIAKEIDQYLWNTGFHYGEWLIPSKTKNGLTDTKSMTESMNDGKKYIPETYAYLAMSNLAKIANILGKKTDKDYYESMAEKMKDAFAKGVISEDGNMPVEAMGAYIIPLHYGLIPEKLKKKFMNTIIRKIEENNGCLDTGFLGTPVILDTLCENGHAGKAYDLLFQTKCPSWLYEVEHGATTIWESWITTNEDGSPMVVSLNHYAFGCVDDWMFRNIGGIKALEAGYRSFKIEPIMDSRVTLARRTFDSEYGKISCEWKINGETFQMKVEIPPCTTAKIVLPNGTEFERGSGNYSFECKTQRN